MPRYTNEYRLDLPPLGKSKKSPIPDHECLRTYARSVVDGEDLEDVTRERYDLQPPVHAPQAYSAFLPKIKRLFAEGDPVIVALIQELDLPVASKDEVEAEPSDDSASAEAIESNG